MGALSRDIGCICDTYKGPDKYKFKSGTCKWCSDCDTDANGTLIVKLPQSVRHYRL